MITSTQVVKITLHSSEDAGSVTLTTTTTTKGSTVPAITTLNDVLANDQTTGTIDIGSKDGTFTIRGSAKDEAGNVGTTNNHIVVIFDTTPPTSSFTAVTVQNPGKKQVIVSVTCDDPTYPCTFEYAASLVDKTECRAALRPSDLKKLDVSLGTTNVIANVLQPGEYEVRIRATDHVGNVERLDNSGSNKNCADASNCDVIQVTLNKPPGQPTLQRIRPRALNVTFASVPGEGGVEEELGQIYDIQWSPRLRFDTDVKEKTVGPTKNQTVMSILETDDPVEFIVVYVRTSIRGADLWSPVSQVWSTTETCGAFQYLDDRYPPLEEAEGASVPEPSFLDKDLMRWRCKACPDGASCRGKDVTCARVRALRGWYRITAGDDGEESMLRSNFTRCIYPPACLGAMNPAMEGRYK